MKYSEFRNIYNKLPYFFSSGLLSLGEPTKSVRKQLNDWCKKGLVIQLRRGVYTINDADKPSTTERTLFSSALVEPSYISLEYALAFYGLIPERVDAITAVTSKKTQQYTNLLGTFIFRHIKRPAFCGFVEQKTRDGHAYFIATPKKAVLDFLYFHLSQIRLGDRDVFEDSFRFQNLDSLDIEKMKSYTKCYQIKKLSCVVDVFIAYIQESRFETV